MVRREGPPCHIHTCQCHTLNKAQVLHGSKKIIVQQFFSRFYFMILALDLCPYCTFSDLKAHTVDNAIHYDVVDEDQN